jgi:hypothetical protein
VGLIQFASWIIETKWQVSVLAPKAKYYMTDSRNILYEQLGSL